MATLRRILVLFAFGVFVLTLALRPLSRYVAGFSADGFDVNALFLSIPAVVVAVIAVVVGLYSLVGNRSSTDERNTAGDTDESERPTRPNILTGQGGTRNRGFEIEEEAPETAVEDHLRYLDERLGDDVFEGEGAGVSGSPPPAGQIPSECPHSYCDAVWRKRGLLGTKAGKYAVLDDGTQVRCEECGSITSLE